MALFSKRVFLDAASLTALGPTPVVIVTQNVGFQAKAVAVNNYSAFYVYIKDADSYIPPFWGGTVLVLFHTTDYAYAELASPFGDPQVPSDPSYFIEFTWTDIPSPFVPGGSIAGTSLVIPPFNVVDDFQQLFLSTIVDLTGGFPKPLPATPMTGRTSLMLQAPYSNTHIVYVGGHTVTADQTPSGGVQIYPGQSMPIEAGANAVIYGVQDALALPQYIIVLEGK